MNDNERAYVDIGVCSFLCNLEAGNGADNIEWDVYGKIESVQKSDGTTTLYTYDAAGNRLSKQDATQTRYYIRDVTERFLTFSQDGE